MTAHWIPWHRLLDLGWLLFLLFVFRYFWRARQVTLQTKNWVKTQGRITKFEWITQGHRIWPKIEYVYQVDDSDFTGESLFLDTTHNDFNSAHARMIAYQVAIAYKNNEAIDVYYNPDKPEQAVLDRIVPRKLHMILSVIAALIVLHGVIVFFELITTAFSDAMLFFK